MFSELKYLHECCALIDRDLKPENFLVENHTGQPKLYHRLRLVSIREEENRTDEQRECKFSRGSQPQLQQIPAAKQTRP